MTTSSRPPLTLPPPPQTCARNLTIASITISPPDDSQASFGSLSVQHSSNERIASVLPSLVRVRWLIRHKHSGAYLMSINSPFWTLWPEIAFQATAFEHLATAIRSLALPPGWAEQHLDLVAVTFTRRPGSDPDSWVADE